MIIDFTNRITEAKVQEMINEALDFTTGVVNLSTATADEIKNAFTDPDRWLFTFNFSGDTYLEEYRRGPFSSGTYDIYFYVIGAPMGQPFSRIRDGRIVVNVNPSTGEVTQGNLNYAPDIVYNLDRMSTDQLIFFANRLTMTYAYPDKARFSATWTYNDKRYIYGAGTNTSVEGGMILSIYGTSVYYDSTDQSTKLYFDYITINKTTGAITHEEYSSNITLTPVV